MSARSWRRTPLPPGWGRLRHLCLMRDPICQWGMLPGETGPCGQLSTQADHIGPPDDHRLELLRGLCKSHHDTRTGRQGQVVTAALASQRKRPEEPHPGIIRKGAALCRRLCPYRSTGRQETARRLARLALAPARSTPMPARRVMGLGLCLRTGSRQTGRCRLRGTLHRRTCRHSGSLVVGAYGGKEEA